MRLTASPTPPAASTKPRLASDPPATGASGGPTAAYRRVEHSAGATSTSPSAAPRKTLAALRAVFHSSLGNEIDGVQKALKHHQVTGTPGSRSEVDRLYEALLSKRPEPTSSSRGGRTLAETNNPAYDRFQAKLARSGLPDAIRQMNAADR